MRDCASEGPDVRCRLKKANCVAAPSVRVAQNVCLVCVGRCSHMPSQCVSEHHAISSWTFVWTWLKRKARSLRWRPFRRLVRVIPAPLRGFYGTPLFCSSSGCLSSQNQIEVLTYVDVNLESKRWCPATPHSRSLHLSDVRLAPTVNAGTFLIVTR